MGNYTARVMYNANFEHLRCAVLPYVIECLAEKVVFEKHMAIVDVIRRV